MQHGQIDHRLILKGCLAAVLVGAWLGAGSPALAAPGTLQDEVARQVDIIKSSLGEAHDIKLTDFTDLSLTELSGQIGPGLKESFRTALSEKKILVNEGAEHLLTGQYFVTDKKSLQANQPLRLTIKLGLVKRSGQVAVELLPINAEFDTAKHIARIDSTRDLALAFGFHGRVTPDHGDYQAPKQERQKEMTDQILKPVPFLSGTRVRSKQESEYEVEILAKPLNDYATGKAQPRTPRLEKGQAFVDIERNELYEIKIFNNSHKDVAVAVSVDGLSVFHFADKDHCNEQGRPKFNYYIVHPKGYQEYDDAGRRVDYDGTLTVVGWFQKLAPPDNYLSFLVTEYGKGAVSKAGIKSRSQVGAIHVQFSYCRPLKKGEHARSGNETGFGPPRSVQQKAVSYEIDPPYDFVTIRYTRPQS